MPTGASNDDFEGILQDPERAADYVREAMTQRTFLALTPNSQLTRLIVAVEQTASPDRAALLEYLYEEARSRG